MQPLPESSVSRVDSSVGIGGYRKDLTQPVETATAAIVQLWHNHGMRCVKIDGSTWEELALLRGWMRREHPESAISVLGGGPILVDRVPASEREYWLSDADALQAAVATVVAHGGGWLDLRISDPDTAASAIAAGHAAGLRISYRGGWVAAQALRDGDHFASVVDVLAEPGDSKARRLALWAADPDRGAGRLADLASRSVTLGTGLLAFRRSLLLREAIEAPFLEELEPILPHAVYLREMNRMGGYVAGRRQLRKHAGFEEPTKTELAEIEDGWLALLAQLPELRASLVPASCAPQLTSVPGYAWLEECAVLRHAGVVDPHSLGQGFAAERVHP